MSLRSKLVMSLIALSTLTTVLIGTLSYRATSSELRDSIDRSLLSVERDLPGRGDRRLPPRRPPIGRALEGVLVQWIDADGDVYEGPRSGDLPVDARDRAVARDGGRSVLRDVEVDGQRYRMLTTPAAVGAVQLARSLEEVEAVATALRRRTLLTAAIVGGVAAAVGWALARQLTRRLATLTTVATQVAVTGDVTVPVPSEGADEAGQLGRAMKGMLSALAQSRAAQHELVQNAGHELRTPLTSLRTNIDVLRRHADLPPDQRAAVLADVDAETRELTHLVDELVELATDRRDDEPAEYVVLADVVARSVEQAQRRSGRTITLVADHSTVWAPPIALGRAVNNLLDNAVKFSPTGDVEVSVVGGSVMVRDYGPGFSPGDREKVFDRFYRADASRTLPGSGLGLSIVQSVVEAVGGQVTAANAQPGPGAVVGFRLPALKH